MVPRRACPRMDFHPTEPAGEISRVVAQVARGGHVQFPADEDPAQFGDQLTESIGVVTVYALVEGGGELLVQGLERRLGGQRDRVPPGAVERPPAAVAQADAQPADSGFQSLVS